MAEKHKIFYSNGSWITDVSNKKTKEQIVDEFSLDINSIQEIEVDSNFESTKIVDGLLVKHNFIEGNKQIADEKKEKKEARIINVKNNLNLSEEDWDDLKEALK